MSTQQNLTNKQSATRWDYLAFFSGILGLILAFAPYVSIIGVSLGVAAVVFGAFGLNKQQKNMMSWLGLIFGSLTVFAFLIVCGLVIFF